jgi:uncharacterized membrane protein
VKLKAVAFEEAVQYQGQLPVPGIIAVGATGVFTRAQMVYNLVATGWLLAQEALYIVSLLVCLFLMGLGLRRVRLASLQAEKAGGIAPAPEEAMADNVPMVFSGIAALLLAVMAYLAVFKPA